MSRELQQRRYNRQVLATGHDQRDNGRRRNNVQIKKSASCGRLAGDNYPMNPTTRRVNYTQPQYKPTPSRSSESLGDPDNWRKKSEEQIKIERQMRQQMGGKGAKPPKRAKNYRGMGDVKKEEKKDDKYLKKRGSKPSDQLNTTEDAARKLEPDAHRKAVKSRKSEKACNGRKGDEGKQEGKEVKRQKQRENTKSHQLTAEKKAETKDIRSRTRRQKDINTPHKNTLTKDGGEMSDLPKKKTKKSRQNSKPHDKVRDGKSGADEGLRANTNLDDRDLNFFTSPDEHHNFSSRSKVSSIPTIEDLQQICSSLYFYTTTRDDFNIQDSDGGPFVTPDGDISANLHHYERFSETLNDAIQPAPWIQATQHCYYNQECF